MSKISISAYKKYHTCPKMYDIHYNERVRPTATGSALKFGIAIDEALNAMLLKTDNALKVFKRHFKFEDMQDVKFSPKDLDEALFNKEQLELLDDKDDRYRAWASMRIKGRLIIEAYERDIYPNIEKVHEVQKELDGRPGFLDAVVDIKGHGKVLLDHKTASWPYKGDSAYKDIQLALYAANQGIERVGFAVLNKTIKKDLTKICRKCGFDGSATRHNTCNNTIRGQRCHGTYDIDTNIYAKTQLIISDVSEITKNLTMTSLEDTEKLIKTGIFPRNLTACESYFGDKCPYYKYCWHKNKDGLEKKED